MLDTPCAPAGVGPAGATPGGGGTGGGAGTVGGAGTAGG